MYGIGIDISKASLDVAVHGDPKLHCFTNTPAGHGKLLA